MTDKLSVDFLTKALQQQIDNNTKLVTIILDMTHKVELSAATIEALNKTLKLYAKEADA